MYKNLLVGPKVACSIIVDGSVTFGVAQGNVVGPSFFFN